MFNKRLYDDDFFAWHKKNAEGYSLITGAKLFKHYKPESVVDFGCGIGSYLQAAMGAGVKKIKGYEIGGEHSRKYVNKDIQKFIEFNTDITRMINSGEKYDISICIEVAEHIEPSGSAQLVNNIAAHTNKFCVWTAAPKGQDGCGHINGNTKNYWLDLFKENGMARNLKEELIVRSLLVGSPKYIMDNLMVIV